MPLWAEQQFNAIVNRYMSGSISSDNLRALRAELRANGLESEFPQAMIDVVDRADVSEIE